MAELSDKELLEALGVETAPKKTTSRTPREARIIAGFEDIQRFFEEHGTLPEHGEDNDIFERLYAVRLDRIRQQPECRDLLTELDEKGLLAKTEESKLPPAESLDDTALLAELGLSTDPDRDITKLKHVKPRAEVRAAEEIANRTICPDFEKFKPLFESLQEQLDSGARETRRFGKDADIKQGEFFVVNGQIAYVEHVGDEIDMEYGRKDRRLRVVYDNGTESDILLRSLQRALYKDEAGRRITDPGAGPLFGSIADAEDTESGTIYVLRSQSVHADIAQHREIIHKIGVTGGDVEKRISAAKKDTTFLFADVEIVATYTLYNINRSKLENLLHRFFAGSRLDVDIPDRFGRPVRPREWFLVPLPIINEVIDRVKDGSLSQYRYEPESASLVKR
ncbi:MAG: GIY-YIG nuclease family protein [Pseudomonadota bacterium]